MKTELKLKDKLCIYGDYYSVLSNECYGCYHFNHICDGPEKGFCPAGIFKYDKYQAYAEYVLSEKLAYNEYLFARLIGETVDNLSTHLDKIKNKLSNTKDKERICAYNRMIIDLEKALEISDAEIERLKKESNIDLNLSELDSIIDEVITSVEEETVYVVKEDVVEKCDSDYDDIPF